MRKLLLLPLLLLSIVGYSQMNTFGGIGLRVNDTTTYQTNAAAYHAAGYFDLYFNNQATNDHFDVWNGSSYDHIFSFSSGGNFWKNAGTTNLTGDATIDNGVHNLLIGGITGPYSSWDIDGSGPASLANSKIDGVGDPTGGDNAYVASQLSGIENGVVMSSNFPSGGTAAVNALSSGSSTSASSLNANGSSDAQVFARSNGEVGILTASTERLLIDTDGSWDLGAGFASGSSGNVLTSNGAGAAPTWQAAGGGGGGTWGSITGTLSSQTDLQTALDARQLLINSATTITDASTMDVTAIKNTLTTASGTRTFTISYTGDEFTIEVTLNTTSSVFTFPATALTVSDGAASGNNTLTLTGVSGDKYIVASKKIGSNYYVVCKNFGQ